MLKQGFTHPHVAGIAVTKQRCRQCLRFRVDSAVQGIEQQIQMLVRSFQSDQNIFIVDRLMSTGSPSGASAGSQLDHGQRIRLTGNGRVQSKCLIDLRM